MTPAQDAALETVLELLREIWAELEAEDADYLTDNENGDE